MEKIYLFVTFLVIALSLLFLSMKFEIYPNGYTYEEVEGEVIINKLNLFGSVEKSFSFKLNEENAITLTKIKTQANEAQDTWEKSIPMLTFLIIALMGFFFPSFRLRKNISLKRHTIIAILFLIIVIAFYIKLYPLMYEEIPALLSSLTSPT